MPSNLPSSVQNPSLPGSQHFFASFSAAAIVVGAWMTLFAAVGLAGDWPQWCGSDGKNMVSPEKNLPDSFVPGQKNSRTGEIRPGTAKHVKWGRKLCEAIYSSPAIVGGKIYIGGCRNPDGLMMCLDERTGKLLWQWRAPAKPIPHYIDGWSIGISDLPQSLGVCSSPLVEENRVYFVSNDFKVVCLDARGEAGAPSKARVVWSFDMWARLKVFPCDAANGSAVVDGDLLYVNTSNGIDRNMELAREKFRKIPAPDAPNLIVLEKHTGRLVATDDVPITKHLLHGQWSSVSLGTVGGRKMIFFGGGDGRCYAFEALRQVPQTPVKLKTVWSCDCIPDEYKSLHGMDWVTYYYAGDKRRPDGLNAKDDGSYVGQSEFIGTPVLYRNRIYLALGRDPAHGRGRGALTVHRRLADGRHHQDWPSLDLPGPRQNALYGFDCRRPALYFRRGRAAALPRCRDGPLLLDFRDQLPGLGFHAGGRRQGLHAQLEGLGRAGRRQGEAAAEPRQLGCAGSRFAGGCQRHLVHCLDGRLVMGRGESLTLRVRINVCVRPSSVGGSSEATTHRPCRRTAAQAGRGTRRLLQDFRKERLHGFPRAVVGLGIVGGALRVVVAGGGIGKGVHGSTVDDELPIDAGRPHLVLEGFDVFGRHVGVVAAVQHEDLAADILGLRRAGRVQAAVEADHPGKRGAAAGEFQHAGASETVADGRQPPGIAPRIVAEHVEACPNASPHERRSFL